MKKFWDTLLIYARPSITLKLDGLERLVFASKGLPVRLLWHQSLSEALNGLELDVDPQFFDSNEPCPEFIQKRKENTLVLTLGGDGTLLDGIQFAVEWDLPVFGFHFGRLGFLSSAGGTVDFSAVLTAMLNGQLEIENRSLVACKFPLPMKGTGMGFALNEMALHRQGAGIMRITCLVNEELLNNYQADGLLVSTPTGSTAYSMSCGGPIVLPQSKVFLITPVAGHQLGIRPVLLPDTSRLQLITAAEGGGAQLMLDGKPIQWAGYGTLEIYRHEKVLALARLKGFSDLHNLRAKLLWGLDVRG